MSHSQFARMKWICREERAFLLVIILVTRHEEHKTAHEMTGSSMKSICRSSQQTESKDLSLKGVECVLSCLISILETRECKSRSRWLSCMALHQKRIQQRPWNMFFWTWRFPCKRVGNPVFVPFWIEIDGNSEFQRSEDQKTQTEMSWTCHGQSFDVGCL